MPSLQAVFKAVDQLPNIPKVVQEVIASFDDPRASADNVAKKIQMDQVLSARILRLANSARYGSGRKVQSIDSAIVLLGQDALRTLVIASGVAGSFRDIPGFDKMAFWRQSFMVANIAKLLAKDAKVEVDRETAFTCGMLHSIGELLLYLAYPDVMQRLNKMVKDEGADRVSLQQNQFGCDYAAVGAELAKLWQFPEAIQLALREQNDPLKEEGSKSVYALVIHLAVYLNNAWESEHSSEDVISAFPAYLAKPLELDLLKLFEDMDKLAAMEDDISQVLG